MTISVTTTRMEPYAGNGSTTTFAYTFKINASTDLLVVVRNTSTDVKTTLVLNTDYTVTGVGGSGGNVVLTAGSLCPTGSTLTIMRNMSILQSTNWVDGDAFSSETIESTMDTIVMHQQQLSEKLDRTPKLPVWSTISGIELPSPSALHSIGWNSTEDGLQNISGVTLSDAIIYEVDALTTYGAGTAYTKATIDSALSAIGTTNITTLLLRPGTWVLNANTDWSTFSNVTFKMAPGAVFSHSTYTVNVPNIEAGFRQIFSGTGTVTLSGNVQTVWPEWFYSGSGSYHTAIIAAAKAFKDISLLPGKTYSITAAVTFPSADLGDYHLHGNGMGTSMPIITGSHSGNLLQCNGGDRLEIDHIYFRGSACTALALTDFENHISSLHLHHCEFNAELADCVYANILLSRIEYNRFGYLGAAGTNHRHLYIQSGVAANLINQNVYKANRFFKAKGSMASACSVYLDGGTNNFFDDCNWEENTTAQTVFVKGAEHTKFANSWFEANSGATYEVYSDNPTYASTPNRVIEFENCQFTAASSITHLMNLADTTPPNIIFKRCSGSGMSGKYITKSASGNDYYLIEYAHNTLAGYSRATGYHTKKYGDSFFARKTTAATNITGDNTSYTLVTTTNDITNLGNYDGSIHTAAFTGLYQYTCGFGLEQIAVGHTSLVINLVTTARTYRYNINPYAMGAGGSDGFFQASFLAPMTAGDTAYITLTVANAGKDIDINGTYGAYFGGSYIERN